MGVGGGPGCIGHARRDVYGCARFMSAFANQRGPEVCPGSGAPAGTSMGAPNVLVAFFSVDGPKVARGVGAPRGTSMGAPRVLVAFAKRRWCESIRHVKPLVGSWRRAAAASAPKDEVLSFAHFTFHVTTHS